MSQYADTFTETMQAALHTALVLACCALVRTFLPGPLALASLLLLPWPLLVGSRYARGIGGLLLAAGIYGYLFWLTPLLVTGVLTLCAVLLTLMVMTDKGHTARLRASRCFRELRPELPGWQARLPRDKQARTHARVLVSPDGRTYFLALAHGHEVGGAEKQLSWRGVTEGNIQHLSELEIESVRRGRHVLWVRIPRRTRGKYRTNTLPHVTVLFTPDGASVAGQLLDWETEPAPAPPPPPRPEPAPAPRRESPTPSPVFTEPQADTVAVQEQQYAQDLALQLLRTGLSAGWVLHTAPAWPGVLLVAPNGKKLLLGVEARRDRMVLSRPDGQPTYWAQRSAHLLRSAQQQSATGVFWQVTGTPQPLSSFVGLHVVCGGLPELLALLAQVYQPPAVRDDYAVLGLKAGATLEEVKGAYRRKMRLYHPDKVEEAYRAEAEAKTKEINAAYGRLRDKLS